MPTWKVMVTLSEDRASFTTFVEEVARPLRQALIARYGPDRGADATADALAYAWEHWDRISSMRNPAGYLYRVGQTNARRGIFRAAPLLEPPEERDDLRWYEPALPGAIASLSDQQRAAVVLVHGYGWKMSEVAEMWAVGFSTVRKHVDRGMARLRKTLGVES